VESKKVYLSLVIPSYNESKILLKNIEKALSYLSAKGYIFEIIVVDDGSTDNTKDLITAVSKAHSNIKPIFNIQNMGKGFSVKSGVLAAEGQYILFSDADFSTPIEEMEKLVPHFTRGFDVVIGSRAMKNSKIVLKQAWFRQGMGKAFNRLARVLGLADINDTQCGFKCFSGNAAKKIFKLQRLRGFCFDVEVLSIAKRLGYKVREEPVVWVNRADSRVRIVRDSSAMFFDLLRIRLNILLGHYNAR